jgi:hypothetical protein
MSKRSTGTRGRKHYEVGYGKPPKANQFKAGCSGNPRGRPKVMHSVSQVAMRELKARRKVTIDGKRVSLPTDVILIKSLINEAAKGNFPAFKALIAIAGPEFRRELSRNVEVERVNATMSTQEAMKLFLETMAQPNYEDVDFDLGLPREKKRLR